MTFAVKLPEEDLRIAISIGIDDDGIPIGSFVLDNFTDYNHKKFGELLSLANETLFEVCRCYHHLNNQTNPNVKKHNYVLHLDKVDWEINFSLFNVFGEIIHLKSWTDLKIEEL